MTAQGFYLDSSDGHDSYPFHWSSITQGFPARLLFVHVFRSGLKMVLGSISSEWIKKDLINMFPSGLMDFISVNPSKRLKIWRKPTFTPRDHISSLLMSSFQPIITPKLLWCFHSDGHSRSRTGDLLQVEVNDYQSREQTADSPETHWEHTENTK